MAAINHQNVGVTKQDYYCDETCHDCGAEDPMLVEFTEQNNRRSYMCRDCYDQLAEEAPPGLFGARILDENPTKTDQ